MKHISKYSEFKNIKAVKESVNEAKGGQIFPGDYVKTQYGDVYLRVDGKVGGSDAYVRVIKGKAGKRKTGLHDSMKLTLVNKDGLEESVTDAYNNLEKIFGTDQETMDMFQGIEDKGTVKDMIEFIDEFGNEEMLSRYGIRSTAQVKKLAKTIMNEATDVNDPVLIAFRATRRDLPKLKLPKVKSRRLSFDKYMDLLDARMDVDQQIKDLGDEMAQTLRDMEQEAEPEGGEIADKYGTTMMKQEKEYAKLKAKKDKIMARIEKHRMA